MKSLFDTFWKEYPRKVGKKQSLDAWLRLKPSPELYSTIMEALSSQKRYKVTCDTHADFFCIKDSKSLTFLIFFLGKKALNIE